MTEAKVVGVRTRGDGGERCSKRSKDKRDFECTFFAADVNKFLFEHPEYEGKIDAIMLDPPRAGIAPKALNRIIQLNASVVVYISCNPATLARDTQVLNKSGYELLKFSLVDQFPHTSHVEAVSLFKKK